MATELKEVALRDGYIEVVAVGAVDVPPYNYEATYGAIAELCREHYCFQVMLDRTAVTGTAKDVLQQVVGEYVTRTFPRNTRIAVLVPESVSLYRLEAAVASRGEATLRLFWDRDKALAWLLAK
jgi:hypothetical protein